MTKYDVPFESFEFIHTNAEFAFGHGSLGEHFYLNFELLSTVVLANEEEHKVETFFYPSIEEVEQLRDHLTSVIEIHRKWKESQDEGISQVVGLH
jgi:hypothetical protein